MFELTAEQKEYILSKRKNMVTAFLDLDLLLTDYSRITSVNEKYISKCYCGLNKGAVFHDNKCPYCGRVNYSRSYIYNTKSANKLKTFKKEHPETKMDYGMQDVNMKDIGSKFWFVATNPNEEGIVLIWASVITTLDSDENFLEDVKMEKIIYANTNGKSKAYKISRGKEIEVNMFDAFNINSKTIADKISFIYDNATGLIDFFLKNKKLGKMIGILECFNSVEILIAKNSFLLFYMYLYCEYPVIEFLVKMDNTILVEEIIGELAYGFNKEDIRTRSLVLSKLLNNDTTKGNSALRIPKYLSDFLKVKNAKVEEYLNWCDFFELEPVSKEQFQKMRETKILYTLTNNNTCFKKFLNVLRYGYKYSKLTKYIEKQVKGSTDYSGLLNELDDYRNMMNIMRLEAEEYPNNINSAHKNALTAYRANIDKSNDDMLKKIANNVSKALIEDEDYCIVLPEKVVDFIDEGNQQHNCVSSYVSDVLNKRCIIFFIRKKDNPQESFITAEYRYGSLYQIRYKNNVVVNDSKITAFALKFCENLLRLGVSC